jgi:hypothetical protein
VNPKQKRLIEAILNFPGHIIVTMRSKTEWVIGEGKGGKTVPEKMGLAPEQGKGIEYEFDLLVELNQKHQATITKDRTGKFQDETIDKPGEDFGVALYDWLICGNAAPVPVTTPVTQPATATLTTPPASTKTAAPANPKASPVSNPQTTNSKAAGETVIKEIADIITSSAPNGQPYFSEAEKEEARLLIGGVSNDEKGIAELRDFKDLLASLVLERQQSNTMQPNIAKKAA